MQFVIDVNSDVFNKRMEKAPRQVKRILADAMDHATRSFMNTFYKERLQGLPGLKVQRGGLFHRFRRVVILKSGKRVFLRQQASSNETINAIIRSSKDPMDMNVRIFSNSKVAKIHEFGGNISAGAKGMPIPLNDKARNMLRNKQSLRDLVLLKINGKAFLADINKSKVDPELLFIIKHGIKVKPRLGFYGTWEKHAVRRQEILNTAIQKAFNNI